MTFQPLIPEWLLLLLSVALVFCCLWKYHWKHKLLLLRLPAAIVLLVMLANPVTQSSTAIEAKQQLAIIVDASRSMDRIDENNNGQTRYAMAKRQADTYVQSLSEHYLLQTYSLSEKISSTIQPKADGNTNYNALKSLTRLGNNIPKQVVFFSDGADLKDANPESELSAAGIKVHTIGVGSRVGASNISIHAEASSPTVFPGQKLPITCEITASDDVVGRETEWVFVAIDELGKEEVLHREIITLERHVRKTVVTEIGTTLGSRLWKTYVNALPNELQSEDNLSFASAQVVDKQINVLVLQGQAYWDTSMAVRAWRRDQQLQVTSWYALGEKIYRSGHDIGTRLDAKILKNVDILVLGSHLESFLKAKQIKAVKQYLADGGNILVIGPGKRLKGALDDILPIKPADGMDVDVPFSLTNMGSRLDLIKTNEQELSTVRVGRISSINPHALIYAGTKQQPIVLSARHGSGKVTYVNAEDLWKWRLSHQGQGDNPASFFWRQLIRTMARQVNGNFMSERSKYMLGQEALVKLRSPEIHTVNYIDPQNNRRQLAVNDQKILLSLNEPGLHILEAGDERLLLVARKDNAERIRCARDNKRLQRLASMTQGAFFDIHDSDQLVKRLMQERALDEAREITYKPLITELTWLLLVFLLLGLEWTLRRTVYAMV